MRCLSMVNSFSCISACSLFYHSHFPFLAHCVCDDHLFLRGSVLWCDVPLGSLGGCGVRGHLRLVFPRLEEAKGSRTKTEESPKVHISVEPGSHPPAAAALFTVLRTVLIAYHTSGRWPKYNPDVAMKLALLRYLIKTGFGLESRLI